MKQILRLLFTLLTCWLCCIVPKVASAQSHTLKGVVRDGQGNPLPGASVIIKGTNQGIGTAADGSFSLKLTGNNNLLQVSYSGFDTKVVAIKD